MNTTRKGQEVTPTTTTSIEPWIGLGDAAKHVGYDCLNGRPPNSFFTACATGALRARKVNGKWRTKLSWVEQWAEGTVPDPDEEPTLIEATLARGGQS
jgi:hypothetical protein